MAQFQLVQTLYNSHMKNKNGLLIFDEWSM